MNKENDENEQIGSVGYQHTVLHTLTRTRSWMTWAAPREESFWAIDTPMLDIWVIATSNFENIPIDPYCIQCEFYMRRRPR